MMTRRERRQRKAERLQLWADKRDAKAAVLRAQGDQYRGDIAFATQPGYIPERARMRRRDDQARQHEAKADEMRGRAAGIIAQAERSIYSDDEDAVERLREKIVSMEAERDRIKAFNATCRKGRPDYALLDPTQQATLLSVARFSSWQLGKGGAFPSYALSNLNSNLRRYRQRLEGLTR